MAGIGASAASGGRRAVDHPLALVPFGASEVPAFNAAFATD